MKINNEIQIGLLVILSLAILIGLTWKAGDFNFKVEGYELKVQFKDIEGVSLNSPVTLNGLEIGRVKDIRIIYGDDSSVELTIWLNAEAKLFEGAKAYVKNMGFLGEKYIGLTTGNAQLAVLSPGSIIIGQESVSLEKVLKDGEEIARNLKEISGQVNERLKVNSENIDAIMVDIRTSLSNIAEISDNVNERVKVNEILIDEFVIEMNSASKNFNEMSYDLKGNPWKLLYKPKSSKVKSSK